MTHVLDRYIPRVVAGLLVVGVAVPTGAHAEVFRYGCVLSGFQEAPPVASPGLGGGSFVIDTDANTVTYRIAFTGMTSAETAAHIHGMTDPGAGAGVVHALPAGNPKVGTWSYTEAQEADILAGRTYVNIHSAMHGGGELRGQITAMNAFLTGDQESTPTGSPGEGFAVFSIDVDANTLDYYIDYTGLMGTESAAHIHGPAVHTQDGGVLHGLPAGTPKIGTWSYSEANEADILAGRTYVNIHSSMFASGEIRGQITSMVVPIDGGQEAPPVPSDGAGVGLFAIDHDTNRLSYDIRFANLTGGETAAHIHGFAPPGMGAGVLHGLPPGTPKLGMWAYTEAQEADILAGLTYVNIHSGAFGGGEIRGQIEGLATPPVVAVGDPSGIDLELLGPTSPNPMRAGTVIPYRVSTAGTVRVSVFDVSGRRVRGLIDGAVAAGDHSVAWDGRDDDGHVVAPGVYVYRLETPSGVESRSLAVLR